MLPRRVQKVKASSSARGSTSGNTTPAAPRSDGTISSSSSTKKKRTLFPSLTGGGRDDLEDSSDSSLTDPSSDEDEGKDNGKGKAKQEDDEDDEDEIEWEDVFQANIGPALVVPSSELRVEGDLHLTLDSAPNEFSTKKKGASAKERQLRVLTHCLHVQFLLFHGSLRNCWLCDPELQAVLLSQVTPGIMKDVERYHARNRKSDQRAVYNGVMEPLLKLLSVLIHWWKKKFIVDQPGLRRNGYRTLQQFRNERDEEGEKFEVINGNRGPNGENKVTLMRNQGEKIECLEQFREMARECRGSRDVGAMLFTALLRALGIKSRMVFSLQPLGLGFTERENYTGNSSVKTETKAPQKPGQRSKGKKKKDLSSDEESSGDDSGIDGGFIKEKSSTYHKPKQPTFDKDLPYPIFWTEAWSPVTKKWITVEPIVLTVLGSTPDLLAKFEPKGKGAASSKQVIAYVVAYSSNGTATDVTVRYLAKNIFPGKTKGFRIPITSIPVYDYEGKVVGSHNRDWFDGVMRGYRTPEELKTEDDKNEDMDLGKLIAIERVKVAPQQQKESISYYKNNPNYVLERHIRRDKAVRPGKTHIKTFIAGKGKKAKEEKVYAEEDVVFVKTVENWWREGRTIIAGEQSLKRVKPRAATLNKKREIEDAKRDGEIVMEGLYSEEQTEIYNPPPIVGGKIPRNSFGNIDIYVPSMIPPGSVHLPLKGTGKLARRLGIDYAEAVTGFEFRNQRAVPYIEGVIIASDNEDILRDAWRAEQEEIRRKADVRREKASLAMWRRFLMGLRIVKHLRDEYGDDAEGKVDVNPFMTRSQEKRREGDHVEGVGGFYRPQYDIDAGGLIREDVDEDEGFLKDDAAEVDGEGGGFIQEDSHEGGGFIVDSADVSGGFLKIDPPETSAETSGGFEVVLDEDNNPPPTSTSLPLQTRAMSFRDLIAQQRRKVDSEPSLVGEEGKTQDSTVTPPIVRSAYFPESTALVAVPKQPGRKKTKIEVQIPSKARSPFVAAAYKEAEISDVDTVNFEPEGSEEKSEVLPSPPPPRTSKRKAAVEAGRRQSKYFASADPEEDVDDEAVVPKRDRARARRGRGKDGG